VTEGGWVVEGEGTELLQMGDRKSLSEEVIWVLRAEI
jgi:hypothetical protein